MAAFIFGCDCDCMKEIVAISFLFKISVVPISKKIDCQILGILEMIALSNFGRGF